MKEKDYYGILGVEKTADEKKIKQAYRKLAKKYHPDTNAGNAQAEKRFQEISEAYEVLSDPKKKELYDKYGTMGLQEGFDAEAYEAYRRARQSGFGGFSGFGGGRGASGFSGFGGGQRASGFSGFGGGQRASGFSGFGGDQGASGFGSSGDGGFSFHYSGNDDASMEDILNNLFGSGMHGSRGEGRTSGFSEDFFDHAGDRYQSRSGSRGYGEGGADSTAKFTVSFEEAALGADKTISLQGPDGRTNTLKVHIPAGIDNGQKIRLKGKGRTDRAGNTGDLFLEIEIQPKKGYERKGQDVYVDVQIPFVTAALGGEAVVPTLYGNVRCRIPAGTQCGSKIRLRGKGIVSLKNPDVRGDEFIVIGIRVPESLSAEEKRKLEEFKEAGEKKRRTMGSGSAA